MMKYIEKLVKWTKGITVALLITFFSTGIVFSAPDNFKFKQWCMDTFYSGSEIYEAYKVVSFDITYATDVPLHSYDFWQKPIETLKLKKGDCEDAVILFSSLSPLCHEDIKLVWGYVYDVKNGGKAKHVWVELTSKTKQKYILEAYKGDWNGIVKAAIDRKTLKRDEIISLPQCLYNEVLMALAECDSNYDEEEHKLVIEYITPWISSGVDTLLTNQAYDIFKLLHGMLNREIAFCEKN